jgi:inactivated superfamily I helicase
MLLPKQQKLIEIIVENSGKKGRTKSLGEMIIEAGYSEETAKNPKQIITEEMKLELNPIIEKMEEVRKKAISNITDKKLKDSSARDNTYIADVLTKNIQLLSGGDTEKIKVEILDEEKQKALYGLIR